jgi:Planctomycete cytochrome C/WD domain, G-beta repeat
MSFRAVYSTGVLLLAWTPNALTLEKTTYTDHVLPLVEQHCAKCHNPDKKKGDLDLTSYSGAMKGGGSGVVVVSGNPDSSKLIKAITHAEEPTMPPNKPPLPEKELAVFKNWIAGGLLETSGSKAVAIAKPSIDLTLKVSDLGKPDGPPSMPGELSIEPVVHTTRSYAINGLAASPWAPLVAIAGQKQILLYNTTNYNLLGVLPFADGQPLDVKFSRSGKLLLVGGGHGAKSGTVTLWNVETGGLIATIGKEYDAVLAADVSPDQAHVALGGPDRLVKIYSTKSGELEHKIKKHTDWVTALAFSPNGEMLASADRNGGLTVWDADNGQELFTTAGHKGAVTSLSWRSDSKLIASSSEDGTVKLWESAEGKQAKAWNAHSGGALCVAYSREGKLLTCGRDGSVATWNAEGAKQKAFEFAGEMALRCAWSEDNSRVIASDFAGKVAIWDVKSGKRLGELDANPRPLADRIATVQARVAEFRALGDKPSPALAEAEQALAKLESELAGARRQADQVQADFAARAQEVVRLKDLAAKSNPPADLEAQLASARAKREKARAARTDATNSVETLSQSFSESKAKLDELRKTHDPAAELAEAEAELQRLKRAQARAERSAAQQQSKR